MAVSFSIFHLIQNVVVLRDVLTDQQHKHAVEVRVHAAARSYRRPAERWMGYGATKVAATVQPSDFRRSALSLMREIQGLGSGSVQFSEFSSVLPFSVISRAAHD